MKSILIILTVCSILISSCGFDCQSYLNENIKPLKINGIVVDKQKEKTGCFGIIIWQHQNKIDTLTSVCYCVTEEQGLWKYIIAGDSLYKPENSLTVEVYRKDTVKKFEYPCCSQ